jgi:hypothetical protein
MIILNHAKEYIQYGGMNMNIKRAFKTMNKLGNKRNYYQRLDVESKKVLVSNGHVIVTVSNEDFEANKQYLDNLEEYDRLVNVALDLKDTVQVKLTTVSILCGDTLTRVVKADNALGVVNEEYIKVLQDVGCSMYMVMQTPTTEKIKTPMVECVVAYNKVYHCNAVLPICCNVRDVLESVLN